MTNKLTTVWLVLITSVGISHAADFNIRDHGAIGDGVALDTVSVQKAIDACSEAGGGVLRIPAGRYVIGTVQVKSNVTTIH